jgi:hypothetical protein
VPLTALRGQEGMTADAESTQETATMATSRQYEANRKNARFSTGPTSPEGRAAASRNSYSHGMTATKVRSPEDEAQIKQWLIDARAELRAEGAHQEWLAEQVAAAAIRMGRCRKEEDDFRTERARRAATSWDHDHELAAAELAQALPRKPELIALKLRGTPQGCDLLLSGWDVLDAALRGTPGEGEGQGQGEGQELGPPRPLDAAKRERAWDLLGLRPEQRLGPTVLDLPVGTPVSDAALVAHQAALVAAEIAGLEQHKTEVAIPLYLSELEAALTGRYRRLPPDIRLSRRYEANAQRDYQHGMAELRRVQAEAKQAEREAFLADTLPCPNRRVVIDEAPAVAPTTVAATPPQPSTGNETGTRATATAVPAAAREPRAGFDPLTQAVRHRDASAGLRPQAQAVKAAHFTAAAGPRPRE